MIKTKRKKIFKMNAYLLNRKIGNFYFLRDKT